MPAPDVATEQDTAAFDELERTLKGAGAEVALEHLIQSLADRGEFRALLDALLLKARHELGLPLIQVGSLADLPEPARTTYEERYVEAIRDVGGRLLNTGEIPAAWPYFRAIGESQPVQAALDSYQGADDEADRIGSMIEVAFNQGAHPRKGFELILENYGICSAITAFESLPPDEGMRSACAERLTRTLHEQLVSSLQAEINRRGEPLPTKAESIPALIADHAWLFDDEGYHIDVSHLASVVRMSPLLHDPATIRLAVELTDYGCKLSSRHRYEGDSPFEDVYEDHAAYLRTLLNQDADSGLAHFRAKLDPDDPERDPQNTLPAQVLIRLFVGLDRLDEAIDVAAEHLAGVPDSALFCPSLAQLCQRAGRPDRLARVSRTRGDLVNYAAAILQQK
ncbi:MAG: hypothetical protein ABI353_03525 [Isosphaeraceae bacterium]